MTDRCLLSLNMTVNCVECTLITIFIVTDIFIHNILYIDMIRILALQVITYIVLYFIVIEQKL